MRHPTQIWAEPKDPTASRQTSSLAALAITLALVVAGLYLVDMLRAQSDLQDCLLSGRPGCVAQE